METKEKEYNEARKFFQDFQKIAMRKNLTFLSLGSNLGNRKKNLENAIKELEKLGDIEKISSFHETKAWGKTDQPDFINAAVKMQTDFGPFEFLQKIQEIETRLGRVRSEKWGPRTMDVDILLWNEETIDHPDLKVPHPLMHEREFVTLPLNEIS